LLYTVNSVWSKKASYSREYKMLRAGKMKYKFQGYKRKGDI